MKALMTNLLKLQEFDSRLNQLKLQKGDLPYIIESLEEDLQEKRKNLATIEERIHKLQSDRRLFEKEVEASKAQLKKYENQLYQVKNNREYDAISQEIDTKKAEIENLDNKIIQTLEEEEEISKELQELEQEIQRLEQQLEESRNELEEINLQTREEENRIRAQREQVARQIDQRYLRQYERIHHAKDGLAVAPVQRGSCGGCFSTIPPQKIVEIRKAERLYTCEYCGRILVWVDNTNGDQ